jgi:hypothetical protein
MILDNHAALALSKPDLIARVSCAVSGGEPLCTDMVLRARIFGSDSGRHVRI